MSWQVYGVQGGLFYRNEITDYKPRIWADKDISLGYSEQVQSVFAGRDVFLQKLEVLENVQSKRDVEIEAVTINGTLTAERSITIINSSIFKKTCSKSGSITVSQCQLLGDIEAQQDVEADGCVNIQSIIAGNHVALRYCYVHGDVEAGKSLNIEYTIIQGTLKYASEFLSIENSRIHTIDFRCRKGVVLFDGLRLSLLLEEKTEKQRQVINLKNCIVENIEFESGNGQVYLMGESAVGNIIGGGASMWV